MTTVIPIHDAGTVTKVRVFIDRAAITRAKRVAAAREVHFAPIPLDADTATLRATASLGGAPVRVNGVVSSVIYTERASERQQAARAELEKVRAEMRALDDLDSTETHSAQILHRFAHLATETISREWLEKDPSFDRWSATFDHLRDRHATLAVARAGRQLQRLELQQKQAELLAEDYRLGHPEKLGYRVTVSLALPAGASGTVDVDLTYVTRKAQWMPVYDARHHSAPKEHVQLTAVALVRQSTGEDWDDIELIATTARPPLSEPPPELTPLIVVGYQATEQREVVSTTVESARLGGAPGRAPAGESEATVEHRAPGKVSIPSSGKPVRVELFGGELPSRTRLEVAPRERPVAIMIAEMENRTGRLLLPGRVNVFRGPNYSGQTRLGFVASGERFRLPLGTEGSLRIKREVSSHPEKKAVITGSVTHIFESRTTIENVGQAPLDVLLRDRVPVSRTEDATVKVTDMDRAMEINSDTGLTALPLTIAPHSKREVNLTFKISAPRGFRVTPPRVV